jgi:hypothetical protein
MREISLDGFPLLLAAERELKERNGWIYAEAALA